MYPKLEINLSKLENNTRETVTLCHEKNVSVAGVIKGCGGIPRCAKTMEKGGSDFIASSRINQLKDAREYGVQVPLMLIRIPMLSEAENVIKYSEFSLNSELKVIKALEAEAKAQKKSHGVILMAEIGDLREGIWNLDEIIETALYVENECNNIGLAGVGTNVGCYGSVLATSEKLQELVVIAEKVESAIGRELEIISGGATTSVPRILDDNMPKRINNLRVGEAIVVAKDLYDLYGYQVPGLYRDCFVFKTEIVELKDKPSHPIGEISYDAFRNKPTYEDKGIRKRAIVAAGKVDFAYMNQIVPRIEGIEILGGASDHTILDVEDSDIELHVGDIIDFDIYYGALPLIAQSPDVEWEFV